MTVNTYIVSETTNICMWYIIAGNESFLNLE